MDTDDLSRDTYDAIIIAAERFHHDLTLQFGVLSGSCDSEDKYLNASENMIKDWIDNWDINEVIDEIFYDNPPSKNDFKKQLDRILQNITKVRQIPIEQRKFDDL